MELTYTLIEGGFLIIQDGEPYYRQEFKGGANGFQKMSPEEAKAAAERYITDWQATEPAPDAAPQSIQLQLNVTLGPAQAEVSA